MTCPEPQGAFYAYPSVKGVLGKAAPRASARRPRAELAELLLDEVGVAVVPGEAFGTPGYFRLSYALGDDDLVKGVTPDPGAARRGDRLGGGALRCGGTPASAASTTGRAAA